MGLFKSVLGGLTKTISEFLDGLQVGEPWKLEEKKGGLVAPLLRKARDHGMRGYVVLEEVRDEVRVRDLGSIDRVQMESGSDKPVFVRGGGVMRGVSTQSRGIQFGVIVLPDRANEVPVRCVHAPRGIIRGDAFTLHSYAPPEVAQALQSEGQLSTWRNVSRWTKRANFADQALASEAVGRLRADSTLLHSTGYSFCGIDDLVQAMDKFKGQVDKALQKIPGDLPDQVGIAILYGGSVVGVEAFDDPASWLALSRSVVRQYKDVLDKEDSSNWSVNQDELVQKIRVFLERAQKSKAEEAFRNSASRTLLIRGDGVTGEVTLFHDRPIHFLLTSDTESELLGDHNE